MEWYSEEMSESLAARLREVTEALRPFGEPRRVADARSDKSSNLKFLAIRVPAIRSRIKEGFPFYAGSPQAILKTWNYIWACSPYYEVKSAPLMYYQLQGISVEPAIFDTLKSWIEIVDNWGHCDALSSIYSNVCHQEVDLAYPTFLRLTQHPSPWARRAAVVSLVHYTGKNAIYLDFAAMVAIIDRLLGDQDRYVAKAIAWVLRETAHRSPRSVAGYVRAKRDAMSPVVERHIRSELKHYVTFTEEGR